MHYKPIHMHSYYKKKYGFDEDDFPNSNKFFKAVISLPLYPALKDIEVNFIIDSIKTLWEENKA